MARPAVLDLVGPYAWTQGVAYTRVWTCKDGDENAIDLSGTDVTAEFEVWDQDGTSLLSLDQTDGLSLGGSNGEVTFDVTAAEVAALSCGFHTYLFQVDVDGDTVALVKGRLEIINIVTA